MKKVFTFFAVALLAVVLISCGKKSYNVTFDLDYEGAPAIESQKVDEGKLAKAPDEPARDNYAFAGWYLGDKEWKFAEDKVTKNIDLVAKWEINKVRISYDTKVAGLTIPAAVVDYESQVVDPSVDNPSFVRSGYRFGGWYTTKAGKVWNEIEPYAFPFTAKENVQLYAYWEPINSKTVTYSKAETYVAAMVKPDRIIINPLEYRWSHEDEFVDMLVAPLYSTEVDWDAAIKNGIADYPGDFSKIANQEFVIDALDYHYILVAGAKYPVNENNDSVLVDGKYDRDLARTIYGQKWTFEIRDDLVFEDGTPIDARTFEFTLKSWLDPDQNAYRANIWYKNKDNANGYPVLNASEYYVDREKTWDDVGFSVGEPNAEGKYLTFTIELFEEITLQAAVGMANSLRLVHPAKYTASIDSASGKSQYGTPDHLFMSYGPYVIKEWDENARLVFNKNYDYVLNETINYKSYAYEIVADTQAAYNLFKAGETSHLGLTKDFYAEYAEDPDVKDSYNNFPQYMIVNQSDSLLKENGHKHPSIVADARFRQALLFGFNRKEFAYNVYAPNTPALLPIPINSKNYLQDPIFYTESEQHRAVIEEYLGFDMDDYGYGPARAKSLFEAAYADWLKEGNTGPVTLKYVTSDDDFSISLDQYIKESYEKLFEDDKGNKRLIIDVVVLSGEALEHSIENLDFDLTLTALGFNSATMAYRQYILIAFYGYYLGGTDFGLNYPFIAGGEEADFVNAEMEVDFSNTYNYLIAQDPDELPKNASAMLELLNDEGMFVGTLDEFFMYVFSYFGNDLFTASPKEPYTGASYDLYNLMAEMEKIFYDYAPLIPTVTRSSSTIYADNVHIEWPVYSDTFGWGAARYRYLTSDPDFADRANK